MTTRFELLVRGAELTIQVNWAAVFIILWVSFVFALFWPDQKEREVIPFDELD